MINVHLIRSNEFNKDRYWEILNLLRKYPGVMQFKTQEDALYMQDDEIIHRSVDDDTFNRQYSLLHDLAKSNIEIDEVSWDNIFKNCSKYRRKYDIGIDEYVVLLTDYSNDRNWFAAADPKHNKNFFVHTNYWNYYINSDLRYPVAYLIATGILKQLLFKSYTDMSEHWHDVPIGCMMDFCRNKKEISLKLRTADICPSCLNLIKSRNVDHKLVQQVFTIMDGIREEMMHRERFVINRKPPRLEFKGLHKKIIFPEPGDLEIALTPLEKTVYIFFYKHPEGVALNSIYEYEQEIRAIYESVCNTYDNDLVDQRVRDLISPLTNSISEKISRIKRKLIDKLGEDMARDFIIDGSNAELRFIPVTRLNQ
ncbi:MAG: hypothetical protein ACK5FC_10310 [Bacteroidota bacterium]